MNSIKVSTEVTGNVWKMLVTEGEKITEGHELLVMESMKMEIPLIAPCDGIVREIRVKEGDSVPEGEVAMIIDK